MSLRFILGRPGTGKTALCLRDLTERLTGTEKLYYLVPEQFTLQSEKRLARSLPEAAFTRVQVLSFNRLAYQLFAQLGGPSGKLVDDPGRHMLLRKVLYECGGALTYYARSADKQGFIENLARTISECNHYRIDEAALLARATSAGPGLAAKLADLAVILQKYREAVSGRYLVTDETLTLLSQRLEAKSPLAGSLFWVDGFTGFTPQERTVLGHILKAAARVHITLTLREDGERRGVLFESVRDTLRILTELAQSLSVPVEKPLFLHTDHRHDAAPELAFLTRHFTLSAPPASWPDVPQALSVVTAPDRYAEAYEAARLILSWATQGTYRYQDIAILCGDRAAYEKILRHVFGRLRIPLFVDTKADILSHPLTEMIRAAVDVAVRQWPYESVFRFLKTRLTGLDTDALDHLENFVLARGTRGYFWRYPFVWDGLSPAGQEESCARAEQARLQVLEALAPFTEGLHAEKKDTVRAFATRVYTMLYALHVPDTLSRWYDERTAAGDHETARTHGQIWAKVSDIFDKLVEILGEDTVTLREFARMLDAGLAQADLGLIPPAIDQVLLGDIGRSRFPAMKALLVIGANEGKLPAPSTSEGLFTDHERLLLQGTALEMAPDRVRRTNESWFSLYCGLCQPAEKLVFLYASGETGGKALRPAKIISLIKEMYPRLEVQAAPAYAEYAVPDGYTYAPPHQAPLQPDTLGRLYGETVITAASRLEKFAECPFAYYMAYNLRAQARKVYQVQSADLGEVFHAVLAMFSREMAESGQAWDTLTKLEITRRVNACVEAVVPAETHVLRSSARNQYVMRKVKRICATSVWALSEHIRRGTFVPAGIEWEFKPDTPVTTLEIVLSPERRMILTGRIDRVDILQADHGVCYVKIIDYKSGRKQFDVEEAVHGTQLQLILYMNALLKNAKTLFGDGQATWEARPGGVFYFHIDDPVLPLNDTVEPEQREALLLRCFRMSGLALDDPVAVSGMDREVLQNGGDSPIIPVNVTASGGFGKRSSIASLAHFGQIGRSVEDHVKSLGLRMTEGDITPDPYEHKHRSACDYCRYGAVCGYAVP